MATCSFSDPAKLSEIGCIVERGFNLIIPFAGLAAFIVLIFGGFQYMFAGGDPQKTKQAAGMITGAAIGLVVMIAIWFIFQLIATITGVDNILKFQIPS